MGELGEMVTKLYNLKELIDEQLWRIGDENLAKTSKLHIDLVIPKKEKPYYKVTIVVKSGQKVVV